MTSKLNNQGELVIDHRNSPGIDPEWARARGVTGPVVGAGKTYESGLLNCRHCGGDVIMHPQREREREWCWVCDAYICDPCAFLRKMGAEHVTHREVLEKIYNRYQRSF
jgi:hypothetical protein